MLVVSPTFEGGQIHLNLWQICLMPTSRFHRQSTSSMPKPINTASSSTCSFHVLFGLPFLLWPSTTKSNDLLNTWRSSLLTTWRSSLLNIWPSSLLATWRSSLLTTWRSSLLNIWPSSLLATWWSSLLTTWRSSLLTTWRSSLLNIWPSSLLATWRYSLLTTWRSSLLNIWPSSLLATWRYSLLTTWRSSLLNIWPSSLLATWRSSLLTTWRSSLLNIWPSSCLKISPYQWTLFAIANWPTVSFTCNIKALIDFKSFSFTPHISLTTNNNCLEMKTNMLSARIPHRQSATAGPKHPPLWMQIPVPTCKD